MYFFGANRWGSGVEVPAHDRDFYAVKNVPHGQIREVLFHSKSTDTNRRAFVYTPPGYDKEPTSVTRSCICSTAGARTSTAGASRATPD